MKDNSWCKDIEFIPFIGRSPVLTQGPTMSTTRSLHASMLVLLKPLFPVSRPTLLKSRLLNNLWHLKEIKQFHAYSRAFQTSVKVVFLHLSSPFSSIYMWINFSHNDFDYFLQCIRKYQKLVCNINQQSLFKAKNDGLNEFYTKKIVNYQPTLFLKLG